MTLGTVLSGCGYVGSNALGRALCLLDEDGDGIPRGGESCGPKDENDPGIEWEDSQGQMHILEGVILDCDDDPTVVMDTEGNSYIKGQLRTPFSQDIPYDGIDNDCKGDDNVDADGDGFPGIEQQIWTDNFAAKWGDALDQSDWPSNVLFALDCADAEAVGGIPPEEIYPNAPFDEPYDDIDQNCAEDNDFDADGDGFASAEFSDEYAASASFNADQPATDCDDARSDVRPLTDEELNTETSPDAIAVDDVPYDGKDKRCDDGDMNASNPKNDFDADNDGWMPYGYETAFVTYAESYGYGGYDEDGTPWGLVAEYTDSEGQLKVGDCYDSDRINGGAVRWPLEGASDPADFHPGRTEVAYDGYDNDCSDLVLDEDGRFIVVGNDFDIDGDAFIKYDSITKRNRFIAYIQRYVDYEWPEAGENPYANAFKDAFDEDASFWGAFYDANTGDCEDTDPTINPAALEVIGDNINQDCDGDRIPGASSRNIDTARFNFTLEGGDISLLGASRPIVVAADEHYMVFTHAENYIYAPTLTNENNVGLAFFLERDEPETASDPAPTSYLSAYGQLTWFKGGAANVFSGEIAGVEVSGSDFYVGYSYRNSVNTYLAMRQYLHDAGDNYDFEEGDNQQIDFRSVAQTYSGLDFQWDSKSNNFWILGCNPSSMHYMAVPLSSSGTKLDTPSTTGSTESVNWDISPDGNDCFLQTSALAGSGTKVFLNTVDSAGGIDTYFTRNTDTKPRVEPTTPWDSFTLKSPYVHTNRNWSVKHQSNNRVHLSLTSGNSFIPSRPSSAALVQADGAVLEGASAALDRPFIASIYGVGSGTVLYLSYEDNSGNQQDVELPVFHEGDALVPETVGITVDEDRVVIAVIGTKSGDNRTYLGWTLMGLN